jgi:hypothetical protein
MDFFPQIDVSALEAEAIARGLYGVALVDGVHERELALISEFYADTTDGSLERAGALGPKQLADILIDPEHRELFVKAALLCAWADGKVSPGERAKIGEYAKALAVSDEALGQLEAAVKDFLLRPFAGLANVEGAAAVAKKLGV